MHQAVRDQPSAVLSPSRDWSRTWSPIPSRSPPPPRLAGRRPARAPRPVALVLGQVRLQDPSRTDLLYIPSPRPATSASDDGGGGHHRFNPPPSAVCPGPPLTSTMAAPRPSPRYSLRPFARQDRSARPPGPGRPHRVPGIALSPEKRSLVFPFLSPSRTYRDSIRNAVRISVKPVLGSLTSLSTAWPRSARLSLKKRRIDLLNSPARL